VDFVAELQQLDPRPRNPSVVAPGASLTRQNPPVSYGPQPPSPPHGLTPIALVAQPPPTAPAPAPWSPPPADTRDPQPTDRYAALAPRSIDPSDPQPSDRYAALASSPFADSDPHPGDPYATLAGPASEAAGPSVDGRTVSSAAARAALARAALARSAFARPEVLGPGVLEPGVLEPDGGVPAPAGSAVGRVVLEWGPVRPGMAGAPIDITPGTARPTASTGGLRRRLRVSMMAGAALAALVGGGVGYAALNQPGSTTAAPKARASVPGLPTAAGRLGGQPGADRVSRSSSRPPSSARPSVAATTPKASRPTVSTATTKSVSVPVAPGPSTPPSPTRAPTAPAQHRPPTEGQPGQGGDPDQSGPAQGGQPLLVATLTYPGEPVPDGILTYSGTVRVDNLGRGPVDGWQVSLMIPGGNSISADGARAAQNGGDVTFTPFGDAGPLRPGDSVTFTFTVYGVLPAGPSGCNIDGRTCN
jgi:cellulose binding protein with CBM2 domain